jgi:hypothetical protein
LVHRLHVGKSLVVIRVGQAARKAAGAEDVHRIERAIEEDERQEEVNLP